MSLRGLIVLLGLWCGIQGMAQVAADSSSELPPISRNPFSPAADPERQPVLRAIVIGERALAIIEFQDSVQVALVQGAEYDGWELVRIQEHSALLQRAGVEVEIALPDASP